MDPDYDLNRLGSPDQRDRLVELRDTVWQDHVPVSIAHNGIVVAVAIHPDDLVHPLGRCFDCGGPASGEEFDKSGLCQRCLQPPPDSGGEGTGE